MNTRRILPPQAVADALNDGNEVALIDVRDKADFVTDHLWLAVNIPFADIEMRIQRFVPRMNTRIILCDADGALSDRAARALNGLGYTDVFCMESGLKRWVAAGFPLVSGDYVVAHAFGFHIEALYNTPVVTAGELMNKLENQEDIVIIDARDPRDYQRASIPGSINIPAADVARQIPTLIRDDSTQIVVHCAGVTRAALGAQTLINARVPNPVASLLHGTKGWFLEGGQLVGGQRSIPGKPSVGAKAFAKTAATSFAKNFDLRYLNLREVQLWQCENPDRTCYLVDVRSHDEYLDGHVQHSINIPGGELAGMTIDHIATYQARLCLIDSGDCARAEITASWMLQSGWSDIVILKDWREDGETVTGPECNNFSEQHQFEASSISPDRLAALLPRNNVAIIDFSHSNEFIAAHIPGANWCLRSTLPDALATIENVPLWVLSSTDGYIAKVIANELIQLTDHDICYLEGGNYAWSDNGYPTESGSKNMLSDIRDIDPALLEKPEATREELCEQYACSIAHRLKLYPKFMADQPLKFVSVDLTM